jgi:hypothetical protein
MGQFQRQLSEEGMSLLEQRPPWWQHLLAYRYKDKYKDERRPLLLAIRNGYLNAYLEGQSVLKVGFKSPPGRPTTINAEMHRKYVDPNAKGQELVRFDGSFFDGKRPYGGKDTFDGWAKRARKYVRRENCRLKHTEKEGIAIIAEKNPCVIDVEMGQNETGDRIDIVALERENEVIKIVFYEVKLFGNKQLRARNGQPEVLEQLDRYKEWVSSRVVEITEAYRGACKLLIRLNCMREQAGRPVIDALIKEAAEDCSKLRVDKNPD